MKLNLLITTLLLGVFTVSNAQKRISIGIQQSTQLGYGTNHKNQTFGADLVQDRFTLGGAVGLYSELQFSNAIFARLGANYDLSRYAYTISEIYLFCTPDHVMLGDPSTIESVTTIQALSFPLSFGARKAFLNGKLHLLGGLGGSYSYTIHTNDNTTIAERDTPKRGYELSQNTFDISPFAFSLFGGLEWRLKNHSSLAVEPFIRSNANNFRFIDLQYTGSLVLDTGLALRYKL